MGLIGTQWEDAHSDVKRRLAVEACKEAYAHDFITALPDVSHSQMQMNRELTLAGIRHTSR